jgi:hypothetical protein
MNAMMNHIAIVGIMDPKTKLILALQQTHNIHNLIDGNEYDHFFASHLLPIKFELERQLTNLNHSSTIKE